MDDKKFLYIRFLDTLVKVYHISEQLDICGIEEILNLVEQVFRDDETSCIRLQLLVRILLGIYKDLEEPGEVG